MLVATFLIAISGLIFELLEGTISSYFMGDSVYHFSLVIGIFMSAMGVGAWLSRYIKESIIEAFIVLQMLIALSGGFSAMILFFAFAIVDNYEPFLYFETVLVGTMIGMEIPLIVRILKDYYSLRTNISNVFTMDYIGALFASLLFPMVLLPRLGLLQSSLFIGIINTGVALLVWYIFRKNLNRNLLIYISLVAIALISGFVYAGSFESYIQNRLYKDNVLYTHTTPYQTITITGDNKRVTLFINGSVQFDSLDEYRYHESLIHPPLSAVGKRENILVIGGGDGLAVRELLKYKDIKSITLVDLDPAMTKIFRKNIKLRELNKNSLNNSKVTIINQDAWKFLEHNRKIYDAIVIDLPDPDNISLSRLYSVAFYTLVKKHLSAMGVVVVQATSPLFAPKAFYSIVKSIKATGLNVYPYHTYVPSFGEWGFVMASKYPLKPNPDKLPKDLKYIDNSSIKDIFKFPKDMQPVEVEPNRLMHHPLLKYYKEGWEKWYM